MCKTHWEAVSRESTTMSTEETSQAELSHMIYTAHQFFIAVHTKQGDRKLGARPWMQEPVKPWLGCRTIMGHAQTNLEIPGYLGCVWIMGNRRPQRNPIWTWGKCSNSRHATPWITTPYSHTTTDPKSPNRLPSTFPLQVYLCALKYTDTGADGN